MGKCDLDRNGILEMDCRMARKGRERIHMCSHDTPVSALVGLDWWKLRYLALVRDIVESSTHFLTHDNIVPVQLKK
jgi:hypothetical protein